MNVMHKSTSRIVGENVRRLRGDMSQTELGHRLAAELGKGQVNQSTIYRLEEGKRPTTVDELAALARIFHVEPHALLDDHEDAALTAINDLADTLRRLDDRLLVYATEREAQAEKLRAYLLDVDPTMFAPYRLRELERLSGLDELRAEAEAEADRLTD